MRQGTRLAYSLGAAALSILLIALAGCAATAVETPLAEVPGEEADIPPGVIEARDAVLDFLRDGANECVPPEGAGWQVTVGGDGMPEGFGIYHFSSGDCTMSVTYPLPATEETAYHVSIGSRTIGLCWQAMVDSHGRVAETGSAAELAAGSDSAAAVYCREQGYVYEVRTQPNGTRCGVCAFPDGSVCSSWAFLRGQCQPGDQPAEGN